jgi:hypothetical protein
MNFSLLAAYWSLKKLPGEGLAEIAQEALEQGLDSVSLRILAGELNTTVASQGELFERILSELNIEIPTPPEAVMRIVCDQAENIISGIVSPVEGADRIVSLAYELVDAPQRFYVFCSLADEYELFRYQEMIRRHGEEYCRKTGMKIEAQIIEEAEKLLAEKDY